jgi:Transposase IS200 like
MTNHLHLAIQVGEVPLSWSMQNVAFRYTRWVNRREGRMGHLFQGRYKAILVEQDRYLLELVRYIHLNPVRAGLVEVPEAYSWSGHRAYVGKEVIPWLTTEWVLGQFSPRMSIAQQRIRHLYEQGWDRDIGRNFTTEVKIQRGCNNCTPARRNCGSNSRHPLRTHFHRLPQQARPGAARMLYAPSPCDPEKCLNPPPTQLSRV